MRLQVGAQANCQLGQRLAGLLMFPNKAMAQVCNYTYHAECVLLAMIHSVQFRSSKLYIWYHKLDILMNFGNNLRVKGQSSSPVQSSDYVLPIFSNLCGDQESQKIPNILKSSNTFTILAEFLYDFTQVHVVHLSRNQHIC